MEKITLFWHRRDLRNYDNAGLYAALNSQTNVQPIFIFDTNILECLPKQDKRVKFIYQAIKQLNDAYKKKGASLWVFYGKPVEIYKKICRTYNIESVYTNRDYEPYAFKRDKSIAAFLAAQKIPFKGKKDHVIFDKNEVLKGDGLPYTVFTPYSKIWKKNLSEFQYKSYPIEKYAHKLFKSNKTLWEIPYESELEKDELKFDPPKLDQKKILSYQKNRDFPTLNGTTKISVHLRFGTISIRHCVQKAIEFNSDTWLNELIWRDFYQMILYHFPHVATSCFRSKYEAVNWENNEKYFEAWCNGKTGYPLVDAGMRELNQIGFMHNRVRMVVASFLTKHLLIDWRWGEAYFAEKLLDFDLASNNGGWQWAAGCGTDAAPYFRIFNPTTQLERFDKDREYVKKWVSEFDTIEYPSPIVEHKLARIKALDSYKTALNVS